MQIVIDIDEHIYKQIMADSKVYVLDNEVDRILIENAIYNGTPLPEHLNKIKAEIEALSNANPSYTHTCDVVDREDVIDIIDKYIKGSESE